MCSYVFGSYVIVLLASCFILNVSGAINNYNQEDYNTVFPNHEDEGTLKLVIVLFRHGNRTISNTGESYPLDPYLNLTYFPYGHGQLTNAGKIKEYFVGTELRNRYDDFLGKYYYPELVEAVSTDYNRTKMSLQLTLASLFPPRKEDLILGMPWQPIPYNFIPKSEDKVLLGYYCPKRQELYKEYISRPDVQEKFKEHLELFKYVSDNTGLNVTTIKDIYTLHFGLATEEEYGLVLPAWTKTVWPEPILTISPEQYFITMSTPDMRKILIGYFLEKVLVDIKKKINDPQRLSTKIYLYSAHENTIAQLLIALGVFEKHIPTYGSYVTLELHQIKGVYGIKLFYQKWDGNGLRLLKIPGCMDFCPLELFSSLIEDDLPTDPNMCGN